MPTEHGQTPTQMHSCMFTHTKMLTRVLAHIHRQMQTHMCIYTMVHTYTHNHTNDILPPKHTDEFTYRSLCIFSMYMVFFFFNQLVIMRTHFKKLTQIDLLLLPRNLALYQMSSCGV